MLASSKQFTALAKVFRSGTKLTYRRGEYVIRPGEIPSGIFYIEEGLVKALNISKYGEENLLIIRKRQEIFPLIWALTGQEREIIYQAIGPTTVWRIDRETYLNHLHSHPQAMEPMLEMVTEMYRIQSERLLNLEYRSVRERLVSFLLTMSYRFGEPEKDGIKINVPLRHQDIASSINSSRETTSRELAKLERRGLVKSRHFIITLHDADALQAIL